MLVLDEVLIGEADELELLGAINRLEALAGRQALARFHFHEDQQAAAPHDQIDLAAAQALVAAHDRESAQPVKPRCPTLAARAQSRDRDRALPHHRPKFMLRTLT